MKKRNLLILLIFCIPLVQNSCTKGFEELNKNPFSPTETDIGPLFNSVVSSLRLGWSEQFYLHNETLYGVTQLAALTSAAFQNITIGTEDHWGNYYRTLGIIRELERRFDAFEGEPELLNNVQAKLKILLAYKTFRTTDLFGDIPFFNAGKGFEDIGLVRPEFDSQESIYKFLIDELKWASENINLLAETANGEAYLSYGDFDNLFSPQDLNLWIKFANSLRLRHALRMVEKDPNFAIPHISEIIENELPLIEDGEDVVMNPRDQKWRNLSVNWSFREHNKLRMGSNIWGLLSENDNADGSGIYDPRAKIFFEPNNVGDWVAYPQIPPVGTVGSGGVPYGQHRDNNYAVKGAANIYSPFNYYLIRDDFDVPEILITAAEIHFMKAEIYHRGLGVAMDPEEGDEEYYIGVVASLNFWQNVMTGSHIWENKPPILSSGELFAIANHPNLTIFTTNKKLEYIYTQRWLDAFRQPWEAYALQRRTQMTPLEGDYPEHYRFAYPPSEVSNNPDNWSAQAAKMGEDSHRIKVWWMK